MKKSELKKLVMEVVQEMNATKTYRVYADVPGGWGWEKFVKAKSPEAARKQAEKGEKYPADTAEEVPDNFESERNRYDEFKKRLDAEVDALKAKHKAELDALLKRHEILRRSYK